MECLIKYFIDNIFDGTIDSIKFTLSGYRWKIDDERIIKLNNFILGDYNFITNRSHGLELYSSTRRIFE